MVGRLIPQPVVEDTDRVRCLLDTRLPDRPVVIVFDEFPDRVAKAAAVATLTEAGAVVVGLTPEWMNPIDGAFPVYRDVSRHFSGPDIASYLGHAFLLRRDRYVASIVPVAALETLLPAIRAIATPLSTINSETPLAAVS
jgi:3-(3-hydroxy-phenyl)propionate hydroxylase